MVYALEDFVREHEARLCSSERNCTRRADCAGCAGKERKEGVE